MLAVEVTDPAEAQPPDAGLLTLVDPGSGQVVEADTSAPTRFRPARAKQLGIPISTVALGTDHGIVTARRASRSVSHRTRRP